MEDKGKLLILSVLVGLVHWAMLPPAVENLTAYQKELKKQLEVCQDAQECKSIAKLLLLSGLRN